MWKLDYDDDEVKKIKGNLSMEPLLLMTAGPSNCSPRTLRALSMQTFTPLPDLDYGLTKQVMAEIKAMVQHIFQTKNEFTFCEQNAAHGGMETIFTNLADPGEKVMVASAGHWSERAVAMAKNYGLDVVRLTCPIGEVFSFEYLEEQLIKHKPVLLFVTHGETSHGTLQPLEGLGEICHKYDCLLCVDAVITFGGVPIFVDRWDLDAVVGASQKAVAAPAGVSFLTFSPRAVKRMEQKKVNPPFYFHAKALGNCWGCYGGEPAGFHYTWNTSMLCAVRESLVQIVEQGLVNVWTNHKTNAERLWRGLERMNFKFFVPKEKNRLCTVTPVILPDNIKWQKLLKYTFEKHGVDFSFGMGPTAGNCIRIGVMGYNARPETVDKALEALEDALKNYPNYAKDC